MSEVRAGSSEVRVTATEELRRMLDERGVEHYDGTQTTLWGYEPTSESTGTYRIAADEIRGGRMQLRMFNVTPEQAIDATLGRGTCHSTSKYINAFACSSCGFEYDFISDPYQGPHFCPNCGRKVVGE